MEILGYFIAIVFVGAIIHEIYYGAVKDLPTFREEPPYKYEILGNGELFEEGHTLHLAKKYIFKKARKMGADALKNFEVIIDTKTDNLSKKVENTYIVRGLPIKKV